MVEEERGTSGGVIEEGLRGGRERRERRRVAEGS